jgi:hypothetical protein
MAGPGPSEEKPDSTLSIILVVSVLVLGLMSFVLYDYYTKRE